MNRHRNEKWMNSILVMAGVYNLISAISVIFFPAFWLHLLSFDEGNAIMLECIGLTTGVFGIAYLFASINPLRYWPIVFAGLLGKIFGTAGILIHYMQGEITDVALNLNLTHNIIWCIPFAAILYRAYRETYELDEDLIEMSSMPISELLDKHRSTTGESIYELSYKHPVMLVFLRHLGCPFCRQTLSHISKYQKDIEDEGTRIALVYQVDEHDAEVILKKHGLKNIIELSDPEGLVYKGFKLKRGTFVQLASPKVLFQAFTRILNYGIGKEMGDVYQMPGVFVLYRGEIIKKFVHTTAADIPPYLELAHCDHA